MTRWLLMAVLVGCARPTPSSQVALQPSSVLERARARPTLDPVRARVQLKIQSQPLELSSVTGGVWIGDRPGRGHLAILGPLGGPIATVTSDGAGLAIAMPRERRQMAALDAEFVLREGTLGLLGLDDLVGLMTGDLPFDDARVRHRQLLEGGQVHVTLAGPRSTQIDLILDAATSTPVRISAAQGSGRTVLTATYAPFEERDDGIHVPTRIEVEVPSLELMLDVRYKSWEVLDEVPAVFDLSAPEGWSTEPLEWAFLRP